MANKHEILKLENQTLAVEKMATNYFKRKVLNSGKGNHETLLTSELQFYKNGWNLSENEYLYIAKVVKNLFRELKKENNNG